ncbi:MAG: T9SS type A sorting domain-containing protein [bacterium]
MKVNFIKLVLALLVFTGINSYSATMWENITFPTVSSSITAIAVRGNYIYLGTSADGFFYSSDAGQNWQQPENKLNTINIKLIATKGTDLIFVISDQQVYTSSDNCKTWVKHSWFMEVQENIQCFAFGPSGNLYLGTDKNVWKSTDDGTRFTKISANLERVDAKAIAVNGREYIYISDHFRDNGEIFRTKNSGTEWEAIRNGITGSAKAKSLYVCTGDRLYAHIDNFIYTSTDYGDNWTQIEAPIKDKLITRIRPNKKGDLIVVQGDRVSIWDIERSKWLVDQNDLLLPIDISDLVINDDDGVVQIIGKDGIYRTKVGIDDYIKDYSLNYFCTVVNAQNKIIPNTTFDLYLNDVKMGPITTDEAGKFGTATYKAKIGDSLRIERKVEGTSAIKANHQNLDNLIYEVFVDNTSIDKKGINSDYVLDTEFNVTLKLVHTTLRYNLLVSVEWDANAAYLDTLKNQLRNMSNYLYDVTDGQLYLNKVEICDNKVNWNDCDIQIFANNMVWPNANVACISKITGQVHMPRLWQGNSNASRNTTANNNWLDNFLDYNYTSIAHELGHYMLGFYDEYVYPDSIKGLKVPADYNYGFMDYQYPNGDQYSSEMSFYDRYRDWEAKGYYKCTAQWVYNKTDCWDQFAKEYEKTYGSIIASIYKAVDRTGTSTDIILGPNNNLKKPDWNVGKKLICNINNVENGSGTAEVVCKLGSGPFPNVDLVLYKTGPMNIWAKKHIQGRTADNGYAKILGARVGDRVRCSFLNENQNEIWLAYVNIYQVTPFLESQLLSSIDVDMRRADGDFLLDNELRYNESRKLEFVARPQKEFETPPALEVDYLEQGPVVEKFPYDKNLSGYKFEFGGGLDKIFTSNIIMYDTDGQEVPVPVDFMMNENTFDVKSSNGGLMLNLDTLTSGIENVPVASCGLFSSRGGLNQDAERASDIFYVASYPNKFRSTSNNLLSIRYDKSKLVKKAEALLNVYRWDYDKLTWVRLGGQIDTAQKSVSVSVNSTGTYALFTYDPESGVNDNKDRGMLDLNISPNPAKDYATVSFVLDDAEYVTIGITNALGIEVARVLDNQLLAYGRREFKIPCGNLPSGVYFCTVKAGNVFETIKLMVND